MEKGSKRRKVSQEGGSFFLLHPVQQIWVEKGPKKDLTTNEKEFKSKKVTNKFFEKGMSKFAN